MRDAAVGGGRVGLRVPRATACTGPNHAVCGGVAAAAGRGGGCGLAPGPTLLHALSAVVLANVAIIGEHAAFVSMLPQSAVCVALPTSHFAPAKHGAARRGQGQGVAAAAAAAATRLPSQHMAGRTCSRGTTAASARRKLGRAGHRGSTPQRYRGKVLAKRRGLVEGEGHGFNATDGPTINILVEGQSPLEPEPNNTRAAGWCGWVVERREDAGVRHVKDHERVSPQGVGVIRAWPSAVMVPTRQRTDMKYPQPAPCSIGRCPG